MITRNIIVSKLMAAVREVAVEQPDFIYSESDTGCVYVRDGQPSCIVGHAAWRLGIIDASFEDSVDENRSGVETFLREMGSDGPQDPDYWYGVEFLTGVQEKQDEGTPWAEAVALADERARGNA